jgi:hypothetical protein
MNLAPRNRQTAQRAGIVFLGFLDMQHTLAHGRHRADISRFVALHGAQNFLRVEALVQDHRAAEIDNAEGERTPGVEVDRRR